MVQLTFSADVDRFMAETAAKGAQWEYPVVSDVIFGDDLGVWTDFRGVHIFWMNRTKEYATLFIVPATFPLGSKTERALCYRTALEFAHEMAFRTDMPVRVANHWYGFNTRRMPPPRSAHHTLLPTRWSQPPQTYYAYARSSQPALAVGLYAEARASPSCFAAFLNYYRVIELAFGSDRARASQWIAARLPQLSGIVVDRLRKLRAEGIQDIGEYLYVTNRCAIAHAGTRGSVADPNNPDDHFRVAQDLDLVRHLAREVLKERLLPNPTTP